MRLFKLYAIFFIFISIPNYVLANIAWYTENFYPFNYIEDGIKKGFSIELVNQMFLTMNVNDQIDVVPFTRLMSAIETTPNTAAFSIYKIEENKNNFQWVGPLAEGSIGFFQRSDNKEVKIKSLNDAKKVKRIGVQAGSSHEKFLISKGFKNLYSVSQSQMVTGNSLINMLIENRIDLWIATDVSVIGRMEKLNIPNSKVKMAFEISKRQLYIAFSMKTDSKIVKNYQNALNKVKKTKFYDDLFIKYSKFKIKKPKS